MKKVITLLALLVSFSGFSQSFQLNEFVNLLKKNDDQLDTYLTKKGYQFFESSEDGEYNQTIYVHKLKGVETHYLSKMIRKSNGSIIFRLQTPDSKGYLTLKDDALKSNYKYISKETNNNSLYFIYKKKEISLTFGTFKEIVTSDRAPRTGYKIYVEKN